MKSSSFIIFLTIIFSICKSQNEITNFIYGESQNLINDTDSEFILFDDNKNEIDLSNVVRDTLLLEKPLKTICNKNCKGLCSNCGSNLNFEDCKCLEN